MLVSLINSYHLEDKIKFVGEVFGEEKDKFLNDAYILVLPSETENFSIRPGTFPETRISFASACPWSIIGSGFNTNHPIILTIAITKSKVTNASSIPECLLF